MPIYEYQCERCGCASSFLVRNVRRHQTPACPKCGHPRMTRLFSRFAAIQGDQAAASAVPSADVPTDGSAPDGVPNISDAELDRLEKDPRTLGRLMRTMASQTGEPLPAEMDDVVRRLEAGEDPDKIEANLGDLPGSEGGASEAGDDTLYDA